MILAHQLLGDLARSRSWRTHNAFSPITIGTLLMLPPEILARLMLHGPLTLVQLHLPLTMFHSSNHRISVSQGSSKVNYSSLVHLTLRDLWMTLVSRLGLRPSYRSNRSPDRQLLRESQGYHRHPERSAVGRASLPPRTAATPSMTGNSRGILQGQ